VVGARQFADFDFAGGDFFTVRVDLAVQDGFRARDASGRFGRDGRLGAPAAPVAVAFLDFKYADFAARGLRFVA
jgi:hypothetical protein